MVPTWRSVPDVDRVTGRLPAGAVAGTIMVELGRTMSTAQFVVKGDWRCHRPLIVRSPTAGALPAATGAAMQCSECSRPRELRTTPMLHSIATVCLSGTLPEKLEAAAAARFDGIEIFESDLVYYDGAPADIRQLAADLGLEITLYQPFRDFEGAPRDRRQRNLDRAERKF